MSICKKITNNKKTLIGFGDYSQPQGFVKSHCIAPIKKLKNELKKYCDLIEIDAYKTSKTCSECHEKVVLYQNYKIKKGENIARISQVYSVIRCNHNECQLCCMDRDINASEAFYCYFNIKKMEDKEHNIYL
jgi:hypothetical protein